MGKITKLHLFITYDLLITAAMPLMIYATIYHFIFIHLNDFHNAASQNTSRAVHTKMEYPLYFHHCHFSSIN